MKDAGEAEAGVADSGCRRYVSEVAAPQIAKQLVRFSDPRRRDVVADVEVDPSVAVVVAEGSSKGIRHRRSDATRRRFVREAPAPVVDVQAVRFVLDGEEDVQVAVVVHVARDAGVGFIRGGPEPRSAGCIREAPGAVIPVIEDRQRPPYRKDEVLITVAIEVTPASAPSQVGGRARRDGDPGRRRRLLKCLSRSRRCEQQGYAGDCQDGPAGQRHRGSSGSDAGTTTKCIRRGKLRPMEPVSPG